MDTKSVLMGVAGGVACAVAVDQIRKRTRTRTALPRPQQPPQVQHQPPAQDVKVEVMGDDGRFHEIPSHTVPPKRQVPPALAAYLQQVVSHGANTLGRRVMDGVASLFDVVPDPSEEL